MLCVLSIPSQTFLANSVNARDMKSPALTGVLTVDAGGSKSSAARKGIRTYDPLLRELAD